MIVFTIVEAVVGLLLMLGLFTRLMSIGVFFLAMGILLGAGWIGTTCLDEWQIGVLGVSTGFMLYFTGGGSFSVDRWLTARFPASTSGKVFRWIGSGPLNIKDTSLKKIVTGGSFAILFLTLFTNQVFHGGIWGTLHNKSVRPKIAITEAAISRNQLNFEIFRVEGADVYGSFMIGIALLDHQGNIVLELDGKELSQFPETHISNEYIARIKPGEHSLVVPLGAKAKLTVEDETLGKLPPGNYTLLLTDVSGITWSETITL